MSTNMSSNSEDTQVEPGERPEPQLHRCPEPDCGRQFSRKYTLSEHMKTHTGEKPHVCPLRTCGKRFSTSGNLARHKRLHGFIQPLECPVEGCICTFPSDNKLEKHMKFHYGGAVHVCEVLGCGKTFSTTGNLNRHMKNQHSDLVDAMTPRSRSRLSETSPNGADTWQPQQREDGKGIWSSQIQNSASAIPPNPDILETLSSMLQDTEITKEETTTQKDGEATDNLFDDIIRFHVADLGY